MRRDADRLFDSKQAVSPDSSIHGVRFTVGGECDQSGHDNSDGRDAGTSRVSHAMGVGNAEFSRGAPGWMSPGPGLGALNNRISKGRGRTHGRSFPGVRGLERGEAVNEQRIDSLRQARNGNDKVVDHPEVP